MATIVFVHAHPDDEASTHRRVDGPGGRRGPPRRAGRVHRTASTARCPTTSRPARRSSTAAPTEIARSAAVLGVARVVWLGYQRLGHDRVGAERRPRLVLAGRRRRGRGAAGGHPARGAGRRRRRLRLARRLRPSRPHPGPPRRPPGRRPGRARRSASRSRYNRDLADCDDGRGPRRPRRTSTPTARPTTATRSARPRPTSTWPSTSARYIGAQAPGARPPTPARSPTSACSSACPSACSPRFFGTEYYIEPGAAPRPARTAGCSRASDGRSSTSSATAGRPAAGTSIPIPGSTTSAPRRPTRLADLPGSARLRRRPDRHQPAAAVPGDGRAARRAVGRRRRRRAARRRDPVAARRADRGAGALAARGDGRHVVGARAAVHGLPRRRRRPHRRRRRRHGRRVALHRHQRRDRRLHRRRPGGDPQPRQHVGDRSSRRRPAGSCCIEAGHEADTLIR